MTFKAGDKVKHKSGGSVMVVADVNTTRRFPICCRYYVIGKDGKEEYKTVWCSEEELELAEEK